MRSSNDDFDPLLVMPVLLTLSLLLVWAVTGMNTLAPVAQGNLSVLPTPTPSPTTTPGWWGDARFQTPATPALAGLPALPAVQLSGLSNRQGSGAGIAPGQPIAYQVLTCPTATVSINEIVTGKPGWWIIQGNATTENFWYWKGELSSDGVNWRMLYHSEAPVSGGTLMEFLTSTVPHGRYQLRIMAVDRSGNYPEPCVVRVEV